MAMTLRLTPEDDGALSQLAEVNGISKQEAAVRAIREAAARQSRRATLGDLSATARSRYGDLLDRLSQ